jgi:hypothetical protein
MFFKHFGMATAYQTKVTNWKTAFGHEFTIYNNVKEG